MISDLSQKVLLIAAAQIILPMLGVQLIYRLADRKGKLAKKLLPTPAKRWVTLFAGMLVIISVTGGLAFVLQAGMGKYFMICGGAVGLLTGIVAASIGGGEDG